MPRGPRTQTTDNPSKPRTTSFFPLRKLKGNQPLLKKPAVHLAHLEEEDIGNYEDQESDNPGRIKGVTEEFMVHLARAVKDTQVDEKCCYYCSSPEHFICNCPLVKTSREKQLNSKEWQHWQREPRPLKQQPMLQRAPKQRFLRHKTTPQTPFLNLDPLQWWHGVENIARVRINGESCMALLNNGAQINTITPKYVSDHSLQMGPITNLLGAKVTWPGPLCPNQMTESGVSFHSH